MLLNPSQIIATQEVRRWHTRPVLREQTVAEHSAAVAMHALHLSAGLGLSLEEENQMLKLALYHDAHEAQFGDIPYPAKRQLAAEGQDVDAQCRRAFWKGLDPYAFLPDRVVDLVEVADVLEAALFAQRNCPEIADEVAEQAVEEARKRLCNAGVARVLCALGIRVEVEL